ncbi:MAG TPA: DUF1090 family protein [Casimicrobiaceae bacterium]|nr:DUF1090 family protein [Casimicrobiaceae bacterium]
MKIRRLIWIGIAGTGSLVTPLASAQGPCDSLGPCAARSCRLDAQIARARDKGQSRDLATLERQRADMVHCSDDGLREKRKMALEQAQARIDRREAELKSAQASGNAAKVQKAERNLDSARKAYAEIESSPL